MQTFFVLAIEVFVLGEGGTFIPSYLGENGGRTLELWKGKDLYKLEFGGDDILT